MIALSTEPPPSKPVVRGLERLAVTGAAGWLGQNLLHSLAVSPVAENVRGLAFSEQERARIRSANPDVETVVGDLRKEATVRALCESMRDGVIIHTAGLIHPQRIRDLYEVNVDGTRGLLQAAVKAGVRRVVVLSSNSPCGCNPHRDHLFDEESRPNPYMHYGRSKLAMEQVVHEFQENGKLETVIIRAPWFYGPFQPARQTLFFQMVRDGKAPLVGDGGNRRSMAYTGNLASGLLLAATHPAAAGETYWIADAVPYTMSAVIDTVERLLETEFGQTCRHGRMRLPGFVSDVAEVVDRGIQATGFYHQKMHVLSEMNKTIACSVEKARRELGYQPEVALEEGMRRSMQWVMEHGGL